MTDQHKALRRSGRQAGLKALDEPPDLAGWRSFLDALHDAFLANDRDRYLLERSLDLSSEEMRELNDALRFEKDVLNAVLAALSNGIAHVDVDGTIIYANRAMRTILGLGDLPVGAVIYDIVTIRDRSGSEVDLLDLVDGLESGEMWADEECRVSSEEVDISAAVVISPVKPMVEMDALEGFVVSITDTTERQKARERIREAEVEAAAAERARRAQASFLANMSHELRTPLNAVIGYTELVIEEAEELGQVETLPDLERIRRSGQHLVTLISDVLDMSKIQAGRLDFEMTEVDAAEVVRQACEATLPVVVARQNRLETALADDLPLVEADEMRLKQALVNLIGNAGKFTSDGVVTVRGYRRDPNEVVLEVEDTGIGIPSDKIDMLFQPFTQADSSTTRVYGGTGLGLAITHEIVEAMRGEIEVESEPGRGSIFRIVLRSSGLEEPTGEESSAGADAGESVGGEDEGSPTIETLLVIDDDHAIHTLVRRHLAEWNVGIHSALTLESAIEKARRLEPDLLFVDIAFPEGDGWAFIERLRADPSLARIPYFVMSGVADRAAALRAGAAGFLEKPLEPRALAAAVRSDDGE